VNKNEAIATIISATTLEPIVWTTGYASRIAAGVDDRPSHFYMTGSMGLASSIAAGVARQTGLPTVVVDGDGSLLMNFSSLPMVGSCGAVRLVHVVLDDASYESTGGQALTHLVDFSQCALSSGYSHAVEVEGASSLRQGMAAALERRGTTLIHCTLSGERDDLPPRIADAPQSTARRFAGHLATVRALGTLI